MVSAPLSTSSLSRPPYRVTRPRLHRGHFCYLRAVVQGLAPRAAWERYLPEAGAFDDAPRVHRMTAWIRAELAAAAARGGDFARARLLRLNLAPTPAPSEPTLEDFALDQGLEACSEAEQLAAYEASYGSTLARTRRRTRLLHRQLDAIRELESALVQPMSMLDGCEGWLIDSLAERLRAHGVATLADLHARVATGGAWWRGLRGIGARKAAALREFVAHHADTLGPLPAKPDAAPPSAPRAAEGGAVTGLVPLDQLIVASDLDGTAGRFRASPERCLLAATNDLQAVKAWLGAKAKGPAPAVRQGVRSEAEAAWDSARPRCTGRAYRKEVERLLLWCILERGKPLSSLTTEDATAFRDFLLAPPPAWCGGHPHPRGHPAWRPLQGPLSPRSVSYALGVLANLFGFLVDQSYVTGNPFRGVAPPGPVESGPDVGRAFTHAQWTFIQLQLAALQPGLASARLRMALPLLYDSGLRLSELVAARTADLAAVRLGRPPEPSVEGWMLRVRGKGGRVREVPVDDRWVRGALADYLMKRGLSADPRAVADVPLLAPAIPNAAPDAGIAASSFHQQLKRFLLRCAQTLEATDSGGAALLCRASCHWWRHTAISHALDSGVPLQVVRENVGHMSLSTTSRYVTVEAARRLAAMQQMWGR